MNIKEYLVDKRYFIGFYIILMIFVSAIVYLDGTIRVSFSNIVYLNVVALTFAILYLLGEYFFNKKYYSTINYILKNKKEDIFYCLPEPKSYIQVLNNKILESVYKEQQLRIEKLYEEKKYNGEFVTSWVHEAKTPIAVTRLIIENSFNKSKEEVLNSIEEEIDKIDSYIEQSLYYSKIDDFSKDYLLTENDLGRIVNNNIKKHAKIFINKRIKIQLDTIYFTITTDRKWLDFILDQVVSNALKYTSENGTIKISGEKNNKETILIIEDNGIGIKEEDVARVFQRGFTGYNGRQMHKSTGMGLYLAKELAQKLGHTISIHSSYGQYTKVKIHFPRLTEYFAVTRV